MKKIILAILAAYPILNYTNPIKMIINQPVVNLRYQPQAIPSGLQLPTSDLTNPLQASQLLLGEYIIAHESYIDKNGIKWIRIDAVQQEAPAQLNPGWIQENQAVPVESFPEYNIFVNRYLADITNETGSLIHTVSIGTQLQAIEQSDEQFKIILPDNRTGYISISDVYVTSPAIRESIEELRTSIVNTAKLFLGNWYSWGGRSAQSESLFGISSVDCSGTLNLSFAAHGLQIPRMSHEQFLRCMPIEKGKDLQPGDFVFFSSMTRYKYPMEHVMLYIGDNMLLESTFVNKHIVQIIPFDTKLGHRAETLESGDIITLYNEPYEIFFGTFFEPTMLQNLRDHARNTKY